MRVWHGPIFANPVRRDAAFISARLRSGVIPFLRFQLGKLRQVRSDPFLRVWIPQPCCSFSRAYPPRRVLSDTLLAAWEILSIPGKQVCESDKSFWQSAPISSFKFFCLKNEAACKKQPKPQSSSCACCIYLFFF